MLSASAVPRATRGIPFGDPIAQELLGDDPVESSLGVFVGSTSALGFSLAPVIGGAAQGSAIPGVGTTVGAVIGVVTSLASSLFRSGGGAPSDPLEHLTDQIPPDAINAYKGADGWWYDRGDNHRLSHEEASQKQHAVGAACIGAHVGSGGWWYDNATGQQLSHAEAWARYQQLVSHGGVYGAVGATPTDGTGMSPFPPDQVPLTPKPPTPPSFWPSIPSPEPLPRGPDGSGTPKPPVLTGGGAGMFGNISPTMMLVIGGGVLLALVASGKRGGTR